MYLGYFEGTAVLKLAVVEFGDLVLFEVKLQMAVKLGYDESDDGYDSDLFENPDKAATFKCPICTCICKDPIETEPCGHLYCNGCLQSHLKQQGNDQISECPSCREPIQQTSCSKFVERQVLNLKVKCSHWMDGCLWKGQLKYFKTHLHTECNFETIQCSHCNMAQYIRGKEKEHFNECSEFPIECNLCQTKIKRKEFDVHSKKLCPNILLECSNKCGIKIKQSLFDNHVQNECKNRTVDCMYNCYGCPIKPKYDNLKIHLINHQTIHLELKVLYLERLAQSSELLSVSNATGTNPEISGLYERIQKPYLGRPVWKSRNKKTQSSLIRFDDNINGWVLDKSGFNSDIIAMRIGAYPTADAKQKEAAHILELEQMLRTDDNEQKHEECEQKCIIIDGNENDEKEIEVKDYKNLDDGRWHLVKSPKKSTIKVRGYSEREYDLEWNLNTLAAKLRRQRSGIQQVTLPFGGGNVLNLQKQQNDKQIKQHLANKFVVECVCNNKMVKMNKNPYNGDSELNAVCNICSHRILSGTDFYHCPSARNMKHPKGYDLCLSCGAGRQQTQTMVAPTCSCGNKMVAMMSFNAYSNSMGVSCNVCNGSVDGVIWHCSKEYTDAHPSGFDLCLNCGKTYVGKKTGLISWLSFKQ